MLPPLPLRDAPLLLGGPELALHALGVLVDVPVQQRGPPRLAHRVSFRTSSTWSRCFRRMFISATDLATLTIGLTFGFAISRTSCF